MKSLTGIVTSPKLMDPDQIACAIVCLFYPFSRHRVSWSLLPSASGRAAIAGSSRCFFQAPSAPEIAPRFEPARRRSDRILPRTRPHGAIAAAFAREGFDLGPLQRRRNRRPVARANAVRVRRSSFRARLARSRGRRRPGGALRSYAASVTALAEIAARRDVRELGKHLRASRTNTRRPAARTRAVP